MAEKKEFLEGKKPVTFVDLFAGAGGISEGFMQAYTDHNYYDFVLASDINENCKLTHRVRYNEQLGLGTMFITEDIMSPSFLPDLFNEERLDDFCKDRMNEIHTSMGLRDIAGKLAKDDGNEILKDYKTKNYPIISSQKEVAHE